MAERVDTREGVVYLRRIELPRPQEGMHMSETRPLDESMVARVTTEFLTVMSNAEGDESYAELGARLVAGFSPDEYEALLGVLAPLAVKPLIGGLTAVADPILSLLPTELLVEFV